MSDHYLDEIEKIKYFKQKIVDDLLKQNLPADKERVQKYLDQVDTKLSIFSQAYIENGSTMSPERFNEQKQDLYHDLCVLYTVLYKLANARVEKAKIRLRYGLDDLRTQAKQFSHLVDTQTLSVYGKTIFAQNSGFDQEYEDGQVIVHLGEIAVSSGSYLAPMISCDEFDPKDAVFIFTDNENNEIRAAAYNYDRNYVRINGNYELRTASYPCDDKTLGNTAIPTDGDISEKNRYNIFINKDRVTVRNVEESGTYFQTKIPEIYYESKTREEISFYVYGASYIRFALNGAIEYKNFAGNEFLAPKQRQKIVLRGSGLLWDIKTDGAIYADCVASSVENGGLYIKDKIGDVADYMIEEIVYGDDIPYTVDIVIDDAESAFYDIKSVVIKQARISELEDIE